MCVCSEREFVHVCVLSEHVYGVCVMCRSHTPYPPTYPPTPPTPPTHNTPNTQHVHIPNTLPTHTTQIKDIVESAINLPGKAGETLNQFLTDTASVTYAQVAQALFDFQQPYNAWVNYGLLWVFCAGFTVLAYVAMILFEHRGHHV